ncbi:MAG: hypothetical protein HZA01_10420 [Nitrospinae bacterium]|nr:hypothetical protein [Nitrospinota bacterium]
MNFHIAKVLSQVYNNFMPVITIPKALREKLGDYASEALGDFVKEIDLDARKDALALAEERLEKKLAIEIGKVNEQLVSLKGEMNLIKAEIRFLVVLTIIAITLMNPVAAEIIKRLLKL